MKEPETMRQFPILIDYRGTAGPCPSKIPWDAIAPYEGHAQNNHQQSLERLAERGGLSPVEAHLVMTGRRWRGETFTTENEAEACAFLDKLVRDRDALTLRGRGFQIMSRKIMANVDQTFWARLMEVGKYERAGGDVECPDCRLPYVEHPELPGFPTFHWICRGEIVKT